MRTRKLDDNGDFVFGEGAEFLVNSPAAVAQSIKTRLLLPTGEWFLDLKEGTAYAPLILGHHTQGTRDAEVKQRILNTPGVTEISSYSSSVDAARHMTVTATVVTQYGIAKLNEVL